MNNCLLRCSYVAWFSEISLTFLLSIYYNKMIGSTFLESDAENTRIPFILGWKFMMVVLLF